MLTLPRSVRIFIATQPVDMRFGFGKLGRLVAEMGMDVYSGHLFAFAFGRGDRIKILAWDHGGFVLWYKRLERGRFQAADALAGEATITLDGPSLAILLDGVDYKKVRRSAHWTPKVLTRDRHEPLDMVGGGHVDRRIPQAGTEPPATLQQQQRQTIAALQAALGKRDGELAELRHMLFDKRRERMPLLKSEAERNSADPEDS